MKPSYSTRWLACWTLFVLALLTLVAGVFAFPNDWRQGLGLTLIGIGLGGPTAWWLRHASRRTSVRHMKMMVCLGVVLTVSGAFLIPWKDLGEERVEEAGKTHEKNPGSSVEISRAPTSTESSTSTPVTEAKSTEASTPEPTPTKADPEPAVTVTEVEPQIPPQETVTVVETRVPPRVTVYSEVPVAPAPTQDNNPDLGGNGVQPAPSDDASAEPTTPSQNVSPTPTESGDAQPQDQMMEGLQAPGDRANGVNQNGAGYPGPNLPRPGGGEPIEPSQFFG